MTDMDDLGIVEHAGEKADLAYSRFYPRAVETVWAALTEPARLEDWMGPALVEPHVGGRYDLFMDRKTPMLGRILVWQPPTLLELKWNNNEAPDSVVRYELTPDGDGTRLSFTHKGIRHAASALMAPGWHVYLELLGRALDGRPGPVSPSRFGELQRTYVGHYRLEGLAEAPCSG